MEYNIAIVHDYLTAIGGAEKTVQAMGEMFPTAPVYALLHDHSALGPDFLKNPIHTSFLRRLPRFMRTRRKLLLPFLAVAPESFDLREFDVVLASSGAFSKAVITKPNTINICYCHSPMRFAWDYTHQYLRELNVNRLKGFMGRLALNYLRVWDAVSADRVDFFIANSHATAKKIKKYYRRDSEVIYPPVDTRRYAAALKAKGDDGGYYLIVSRLSSYKKIDIAIEAFNKLGWNLVVVGTGTDMRRLKKLAGPTVKIVGAQAPERLESYYARARGYILPGEEDFGIAAVEAMAAGKPVLALRAGGALETVIEGVTGEFFDSPTTEVLAEGAYRLENARKRYDPAAIQDNAQKFSKERFQQELRSFIDKKYEEFRRQ